MPELGIAEPLLLYLQKLYSIDILIPMLDNHPPSLATKSALCQHQHSLLTLVSGILVHVIESCSSVFRGKHKANKPQVSHLGILFTYSTPFFMVKLFLM